VDLTGQQTHASGELDGGAVAVVAGCGEGSRGVADEGGVVGA